LAGDLCWKKFPALLLAVEWIAAKKKKDFLDDSCLKNIDVFEINRQEEIIL